MFNNSAHKEENKCIYFYREIKLTIYYFKIHTSKVFPYFIPASNKPQYKISKYIKRQF